MVNVQKDPMTGPRNCPLCFHAGPAQLIFGSHWRIWFCRSCTNAWTDPPPASVSYDLNDFHNKCGAGLEASLEDLSFLPAAWQRAIRQQVALLQRHLTPGARILEIGCGSGILLAALRESGFEVVGIEPSHVASARARKHGLKVYQGYFPDHPRLATEKPFDAIVMSHVLEHIATPLGTLEAIADAAPDGQLLLVQTNWRSMTARVEGAAWYAWMPDEHFWHFTPEGLNALSARLGFRELAREYSSLVPAGWPFRLASALANLSPRQRDQFHLLLAIPPLATAKFR